MITLVLFPKTSWQRKLHTPKLHICNCKIINLLPSHCAYSRTPAKIDQTDEGLHEGDSFKLIHQRKWGSRVGEDESKKVAVISDGARSWRGRSREDHKLR